MNPIRTRSSRPYPPKNTRELEGILQKRRAQEKQESECFSKKNTGLNTSIIAQKGGGAYFDNINHVQMHFFDLVSYEIRFKGGM